MITRITKLDGFSDVLMDRDLAKVFEEGHVYSAVKILDQIIITDLGKHAKMKMFKGQSLNEIAMDGSYCLTEENYKRQSER